jgi:hypothetical protein
MSWLGIEIALVPDFGKAVLAIQQKCLILQS